MKQGLSETDKHALFVHVLGYVSDAAEAAMLYEELEKIISALVSKATDWERECCAALCDTVATTTACGLKGVRKTVAVDTAQGLAKIVRQRGSW